jgi:hypothetical protein
MNTVSRFDQAGPIVTDTPLEKERTSGSNPPEDYGHTQEPAISPSRSVKAGTLAMM